MIIKKTIDFYIDTESEWNNCNKVFEYLEKRDILSYINNMSIEDLNYFSDYIANNPCKFCTEL